MSLWDSISTAYDDTVNVVEGKNGDSSGYMGISGLYQNIKNMLNPQTPLQNPAAAGAPASWAGASANQLQQTLSQEQQQARVSSYIPFMGASLDSPSGPASPGAASTLSGS